MTISITDAKFTQAHEIFKEYMLQKSNGIPFIDFLHPTLIKEEISYKYDIIREAQKKLVLSKWKNWLKTPGKILKAAQEVCSPKISINLLEQRYGPFKSSASALYRAKKINTVKALEIQLYDFFLDGGDVSNEFGIRFNGLIDFLKKERLGCNWRFISYLAFLQNYRLYFPILPTKFEELLHFYGIRESLSGTVSWEKYRILLDVAEVLKDKLAIYGHMNAIEIQSYMWVIANRITKKGVHKKGRVGPFDFANELSQRKNRAAEKERIGLIGEQYICNFEQKKLREAGRSDLADNIEFVALSGSDVGYDIRSFTSEGKEIHIEVKSTTRSECNDDGFWLSESERNAAERDKQWTIYRVWNIDTDPIHCDLGNIILNRDSTWSIHISGWYVKRNISS